MGSKRYKKEFPIINGSTSLSDKVAGEYLGDPTDGTILLSLTGWEDGKYMIVVGPVVELEQYRSQEGSPEGKK